MNFRGAKTKCNLMQRFTEMDLEEASIQEALKQQSSNVEVRCTKTIFLWNDTVLFIELQLILIIFLHKLSWYSVIICQM